MVTAPPPALTSTRYESLDLWRGFACLLVLLNHSVWYSRSGPALSALDVTYDVTSSIAARLWMGVPIFFVISGYCITATAVSHAGGRRPVRHYFYKRLRRIFPPYWVVLIGYAIVVGVADLALDGGLTEVSQILRPWWYSVWQWIGSITLTEIWRWHLIGGQQALVLGHAWTLCYEEQFYAVTGVLLLFGPKRYFHYAGAVTLVVAVVMAVGTYRNWPIGGYFFDGSWLQFAMGVLLFHALNRSQSKGRILSATCLVAAIVLAMSVGPADLLSRDKTTAQAFLVAGVFALAALLLHRWDERIAEAPALSGIRRCGLMCYSLYLVHLPVILLMRAGLDVAGVDTARLSPFVSIPVCGAMSLWLSWQFHVFVERRFMTLRQRTAPVTIPIAAVAPRA